MAELFEQVLQYSWRVIVITALQLGILLGPAILLGLVIQGLAGFVRNGVALLFGERVYLALFGWLGTSVHEGSHALFCILFRHKIVEMRLFRPDRETGTLGYVKHSYNPHSPYQVAGNLFIGVAPILMGALLIYVVAWLLVGPGVVEPVARLGLDAAAPEPKEALEAVGAGLVEEAELLMQRLLSDENLGRWQLWVFLYLAFALGSSMRLSGADLKGARLGFAALVLALLLFNALTGWVGDFGERAARSVTSACGFLYSAMILSVFLNGLAAGLVLVLRVPSWVARKMG